MAPSSKTKRTGKAASSSRASSSRAPPPRQPTTRSRGNLQIPTLDIVFRDDEHREKYETLSVRKVIPTRYIDDEVLNIMGIREDIYWMINRIGWNTFMGSKEPTYQRLTLEFLSSLRVEASRDFMDNEGSIQFRLMDREFSFNMLEFNDLFRLPNGGERRFPSEFRKDAFWGQLTGISMFNTSNSRAAAIQNPCFRYMHRVLSHTIFGRGESDGVVRVDELFFLWCMVTGCHVDTGFYLAKQFAKVAKADSGDIVMGGLITHIARSLRLPLMGLPPVMGKVRLDVAACTAMGMLLKDGDTYFWILTVRGDRSLLPLPNPQQTTVQNEANWKLSADDWENPQTSRQNGPPPAPLPVRSTMDVLLEEQMRQGEMLQALNVMMKRMHDWHLSQGHFLG